MNGNCTVAVSCSIFLNVRQLNKNASKACIDLSRQADCDRDELSFFEQFTKGFRTFNLSSGTSVARASHGSSMHKRTNNGKANDGFIT